MHAKFGICVFWMAAKRLTFPPPPPAGRAVNGSVIFEKELDVTSDKIHGVGIGKIRDTAVPLTATSLNTALTFEKPVQVRP